MDAHLGYAKHDPAGNGSGNSRNGKRVKTVLTDVGPVQIEVPRDRDARFEPQIVAKRQRRLGGVDDMVISLVAKGLTTGEVQAHLAEIYGVEVSRETISKITDRVLEGLAEWQSRPLDPVYAVMFIDVINVKIRDGNVANRPIYVALAVTADGERDVLGLWAGEHGDGEGAKYWLRVLAEIKNRGTADVLMVVCDGLKGLPDAIGQVWPQAITQTCIVHLLRNSFRYASKRDWGQLAKDLKPVYTAAVRGRRPRRVRRVQRHLGKAVPGDHPAVGERLGRVRPVPGLRPGDTDDHLHDQRDRVPQRPVPPLGQGPRPLPDRAGRPQAPLPHRPQPRPHRARTATLEQPVESRPERLRHHLRRTPQRGQEVTHQDRVTPLT